MHRGQTENFSKKTHAHRVSGRDLPGSRALGRGGVHPGRISHTPRGSGGPARWGHPGGADVRVRLPDQRVWKGLSRQDEQPWAVQVWKVWNGDPPTLGLPTEAQLRNATHAPLLAFMHPSVYPSTHPSVHPSMSSFAPWSCRDKLTSKCSTYISKCETDLLEPWI